MDRESMKRLKLDRRLIGRRSWIGQEELARELDGLPDVSGKIAPADEAKDSESSREPAEAAPSPGWGEKPPSEQ